MHARRPSIPTAERVRALLDSGRSYETIGRVARDLAGPGVHACHRACRPTSATTCTRRARRPARARRQLPAARQPPPAQSRSQPDRGRLDRAPRRGRTEQARWLSCPARRGGRCCASCAVRIRWGAVPRSSPGARRPTRRGPRLADRVVKSVCPYCAVGCAQNVYVKDERVIQIEGDPDAPHSRGRLCPKGSATLQLTTGSSREQHVLYRRPYGTDWERLDLETAMDMVADRVVAVARQRLGMGARRRAHAPLHEHRRARRRDARQRGELPDQEAADRARDHPGREPGARLPQLDGRRAGHLVRPRRVEHAARATCRTPT